MGMKKVILIMFFLACFSIAKAQKVDVYKKSIIVSSSDLIDCSFELAKKILGVKNFYFDRYVIKGDNIFYRPGIRVFRKRTYRLVNGDLIKLHRQ